MHPLLATQVYSEKSMQDTKTLSETLSECDPITARHYVRMSLIPLFHHLQHNHKLVYEDLLKTFDMVEKKGAA